MKILIADDDSTSRIVLSATLKKLGHEVTMATNGTEAWTEFEKNHVPLLISDIVMPDINGLDLCRRIRAANLPNYTYIMLLTVVGGKSGYLAGMRAGADDFITKPFDEEQLAARIGVAERILNMQSQINQLTDLLPICSMCHKVRDDQIYRHHVAAYIASRATAKFSHGLCPDCDKKAS